MDDKLCYTWMDVDLKEHGLDRDYTFLQCVERITNGSYLMSKPSW